MRPHATKPADAIVIYSARRAWSAGDSCTDWFTKFDAAAFATALIIYSTPRALRRLRMILNLGWK